MENIIKSIVMLIDMYYYRKRLMKRYKSIKYYQRHRVLKQPVRSYSESLEIKKLEDDIKSNDITEDLDFRIFLSKKFDTFEIKVDKDTVHILFEYKNHKNQGLTISRWSTFTGAINKVSKRISDLDYILPNQQYTDGSKPRRLSDSVLLHLNNIGAQTLYINNTEYDLFRFRIKYKEHTKEFEFTNNESNLKIDEIIKDFILHVQRVTYTKKIELAKKNNPHGLEIGKQYLMKYKFYEESHFTLVTITRFTDLCFPWAICSTGYRYNGIITPNRYDIKTIDGKWIHNCKQWDEFQAKKKKSISKKQEDQIKQVKKDVHISNQAMSYIGLEMHNAQVFSQIISHY